jgi:hypothetical protein
VAASLFANVIVDTISIADAEHIGQVFANLLGDKGPYVLLRGSNLGQTIPQ